MHQRKTPPDRLLTVLGRLLTTRSAALVLLLGVLVSVGLIGALRGVEAPGAVGSLPAGSESARVQEQLATFAGHEDVPVLAVVTREDGAALTRADLTAASALGEDLRGVVAQSPGAPVGDGPSAGPATAIPSEDGEAAVVLVPVNADRPNAEVSDTVETLRAHIADEAPSGLDVAVTGGPAFGADIAASFKGANVMLLLATIGVVAVLLILTYRSPVLFLVPLAVVGLADQLAAVVTAALGHTADVHFDAGVISVLVFGAGTNYALLLISRYREELRRHEDHHHALAVATRGSVGAIVASNLTVVLALLTLVLTAMPSTRGLGLAGAAGLLVALVTVLTLLPAALALVGRKAFWPYVPRVGEDANSGSVWRRVASVVTARPAVAAAASVVVLGALAAGLLGTKVGLSQTDQFRVASESAAGLEVLSEHFPAGEAQPLTVLTRDAAADAVLEATKGVDGVVRASAAGESGGWTRISVVGTAEPSSDASARTVRDLRAAVADVEGADALVGGASAQDVDVRDASAADLRLIVPLVLGVVLLVLGGLLRSVVAPIVLVLVNVASAVAAIGLGSVVSRWLFDVPALDVNVPVLAFVFLIALGIDYTIFLAHRARAEAATHGTVGGVVEALAHTGGVITSAGVVLAGVFAALGVLPLVTLGQLGVIVGLGVLIDTLLVRTVAVPAVFGLLGDRMWWPGSVTRRHAGSTA
ncbi:MMPL family transporter [Janibacter sp. G56]|uniref:MMPL family transporter n=1 Tax=Janibacter sp. G56 TaxID=3418717 RepID=UPI003D04FB66